MSQPYWMPNDRGYVSSPYGWRTDPLTGERDAWHGGIDLVLATTQVCSVCEGTVIQSRIVSDKSNKTSEWGNYICVACDDGITIYYCHLERRMVSQYDDVRRGQVIGIEGATGKTTGVHLHLEMRTPTGIQFDPSPLLGIQNRAGYTWDRRADYVKQASNWAADAVQWAVENKLINGTGSGWDWQQPVTREQLAVILKRYDDRWIHPISKG